MTQTKKAGPAIAHLAAVWLFGCVLTGVQFQAVLIALFAGGTAPLAVVVGGGVAALAVPALAGLGTAARTIVPLTRRRRGLWAWAVCVHALGTIGAFGVVVVNFQVNRLENGLLLYPAGGICYALAAALLLPDTRVKLGALGAAAALAVGGSYAAWDATRPPTLDEWLTANDVDRALLRIGDPPPGYTLRVLGASEDGFGADYKRPHSDGLHLAVARTGYDTRRADARGCPVPFGEPIHCTDDGGGRQLVTYEGGYEHQELRLRRDGLTYTVTLQGTDNDLTAARHILSTLRPATDGELDRLRELPMRQ
ncbi:hypothetical protein SSP24_35640 [Streptomyces spinoverrucosus]|uniref:Uncharacterized protein n=1 Tax=Streptomyces spinoverrucosus TaxID=284043 RepID=A0A4Y3VK08_9ACTN|nr:hypothetical protein [Streptomyces spinoverrucosus]GEC05909.1 hypothetical protein SSP24_35640 [Streptomyces spinoverrucosus]GHB74511.1 hypothetical protein GCM10010397_51250 [Streptomyces spinoverrucosus]